MTTPLDLVFMGTPDFAAAVLAGLVAAGHRIGAVYTQPPRPAGRGHRLQSSPVQLLAERIGAPVYSPAGLRDAAAQDEFAGIKPDAAVIAAYGLILPPPILAAPRLGCLNIHASLLPRWRGAAPIQRALMAGDAETGITIMQMDAGLDTGPMLLQERLPIAATDDAGALHDKLAALGARLIVVALAGRADGTLIPQPQPAAGVTYAAKIGPADERLDWRRRAGALAAQVRALSPRPGAWFAIDGDRLKVLAAEPVVDAGGEPGRLLDDRLTVACGAGALRILRIQRAGKAPMAADEFLRGFRLAKGAALPLPEGP